MQTGKFSSFDGTKIFYSIDGSGPPLLFLYGLVCSKEHWKYQLEYFKKNYTVIYADYRGHQNSDTPKDPSSVTIENLGHDTELLLKELNINKIFVFSHSIGVTVALELYRRCPQKIAGLILSNGVSRLPLESLLLTNINQYVTPLLFELYKKFPSLCQKVWELQSDSKIISWIIGRLGFNMKYAKSEDVQTYVKNVSKVKIEIFLHLLQAYEQYDATSWLHTIKAPTLIIAGEKDLITPIHNQQMMAQLIPNAHLEIVPQGSHCPQLDLPDYYNVLCENFLKKINYV
jgi:pimeloyl-ACP methyl ester carboxylesterase